MTSKKMMLQHQALDTLLDLNDIRSFRTKNLINVPTAFILHKKDSISKIIFVPSMKRQSHLNVNIAHTQRQRIAQL